jgi:hypothetical protein
VTSWLSVTRSHRGAPPWGAEAELATVEVLEDAVSLTLDDGEQIVFVEDEMDRAIMAERQQRRSAA